MEALVQFIKFGIVGVSNTVIGYLVNIVTSHKIMSPILPLSNSHGPPVPHYNCLLMFYLDTAPAQSLNMLLQAPILMKQTLWGL